MGQALTTPKGKANKKGPNFTCFARLPIEIRLKIWEAALPQHRDSNAGHLVWTWKRFQGKKRVPNVKVPLDLLGSCRESRLVALQNGSFMPLDANIVWSKSEMLWIDNRVKTLVIPFDTPTLGRFSTLPSNIEAVADIAPLFSLRGIKDIQKFLTERQQGESPCTVKTVYLGLFMVPLAYSRGQTIGDCPCVDSDSAVVGLGDDMLLTYLTSAYKAHVEQTLHGSYQDYCYSAWAAALLVELRYQWQSFRFDEPSVWDPSHGIELKPAVIFGKSTSFYPLRALHDLIYLDSFVHSGSDDSWFELLLYPIIQGRLFWDMVLPGSDGIFGTQIRNLLEP